MTANNFPKVECRLCGYVEPIDDIDLNGICGDCREIEAEAAEEREAIRAAIAMAVADALSALGWSVSRHGSNLSSSEYIEAGRGGAEIKIRIADHALPPTYGRLNGYADIEIAIGYIDGDTDLSVEPTAEAVGTVTEFIARRCA